MSKPGSSCVVAEECPHYYNACRRGVPDTYDKACELTETCNVFTRAQAVASLCFEATVPF